MYSILKPALFRIEPERAHQLTLTLLRFAGIFSPSRFLLELIYSANPAPVTAFGYRFRNPIGLAAGYDKDGLALRGLAALGFGHLEIGTVTPLPQPGNPGPRLFRLVEDQALINRMGFPSRGSAFLQRRLSRKDLSALHRVGVLIGVNLGRNKDTPNEQAVFDYLALLQNFAPHADYLAINVSSPNTPGLRDLQDRAALESLLSQLDAQRRLEEKHWQKRLPLLVKLSPDLSDGQLDDALEASLRTRMDGLILTNTTLERGPLRSPQRSESGGLSGRPLAARSESILQQVVKRVDGKIPIVSVGGIMSPEDARRRLDLGATLIQVYTGLIYHGPGFVKNLLKGLSPGLDS
jgi:dihydroorotate dehydrogenase